jgi:hypothetical protein
MTCRHFKSRHVGFVDDLLSAADMAEMRRHLRSCPDCAALDVRIRRSLLVVRNLPQIEPSADFYARLTERLRTAPTPIETRQRSSAITAIVTTAALAAAVYFALAGGMTQNRDAHPSSSAPVAVAAEPLQPEPALAAPVSAGVPVWPAMFMVADLPTRLTPVELTDNGLAR